MDGDGDAERGDEECGDGRGDMGHGKRRTEIYQRGEPN